VILERLARERSRERVSHRARDARARGVVVVGGTGGRTHRVFAPRATFARRGATPRVTPPRREDAASAGAGRAAGIAALCIANAIASRAIGRAFEARSTRARSFERCEARERDKNVVSRTRARVEAATASFARSTRERARTF
jgi:hypothetical protein